MGAVKNGFLDYIIEPVRLTFIISVILSLVAIFGVVTIGKDGAFYIDIAQSVSEKGVSVAFDRFNWPWYSILIAITHDLTRLSHEFIAYSYAVLFMAGACALVVSIVKRKTPEAAYWAALLVLSLPSFNEFRDSIIRETGFWFFIVLTIWLVVSSSAISFSRGLAIQLAIICAAFFRLEALFIVPAIFVFLLLDYQVESFKNRTVNVFKVFFVFFTFILVIGMTAITSDFLSQSRVSKYLRLINPYVLYESFLSVSDKFAQVALRKWSYSDASTIVFFGFLAALIVRVLSYAGVVSFLLLDSKGRQKLKEGAEAYKLNFIAAVLYFCVLLVFFFQSGFANSRYTSMLLWLVIPIIAVSIHGVKDKWPRLIKFFIFLSVFFAFANVISTSTKKTHYLEAAQWVKENTMPEDKIFYDDSRVAYYAGRGYPMLPGADRVLGSQSARDNYKYFIIESDTSDVGFLNKMTGYNFKLISEKSNGKKTLYIFSR